MAWVATPGTGALRPPELRRAGTLVHVPGAPAPAAIPGSSRRTGKPTWSGHLPVLRSLPAANRPTERHTASWEAEGREDEIEPHCRSLARVRGRFGPACSCRGPGLVHARRISRRSPSDQRGQGGPPDVRAHPPFLRRGHVEPNR